MEYEAHHVPVHTPRSKCPRPSRKVTDAEASEDIYTKQGGVDVRVEDVHVTEIVPQNPEEAVQRCDSTDYSSDAEVGMQEKVIQPAEYGKVGDLQRLHGKLMEELADVVRERERVAQLRVLPEHDRDSMWPIWQLGCGAGEGEENWWEAAMVNAVMDKEEVEVAYG